MSSAPRRNTAQSPDVPHQSSGAAVTVRKEFMVPGERFTKVLQSRIKVFEGWYFVFLFLSMGAAEMKDVNPVPRDQDPTKTPSPPRKHTWVCRGKLIITFCFRDAFFSVPSTFCSMKVKKNKLWKRQEKGIHWVCFPLDLYDCLFVFLSMRFLGNTSWWTWFIMKWFTWFIQVPAGKLISLMFLNAFHWWLPWARLSSGLTAQARWRGFGLFLQNLLSRTKPLTSGQSQALHWKLVQNLHVWTQTVTVSFPGLRQNSLTLTEQLHHHFRSPTCHETTAAFLKAQSSSNR